MDQFNILVLGNFSGWPRDNVSLRPARIDQDEFDSVMRRLQVRWTGEVAGQQATIPFRCLDDFSPDALFANHPALQQLAALRQKLASPDSLDQAIEQARELLGLDLPAAPQPGPPQSEQPPAASADDQGQSILDQAVNESNLLDDVLAETGSSPSRHEPTAWEQLAQQIGEQYAQPSRYAEQAKIAETVDRAAAELITRMLHDPEFQQLESAWRGLDFLRRRLELDVDLKLFMLDVTQPEILAELQSEEDVRRTRLYELLAETSPWSLLVGNFQFGRGAEDQTLLRLIATFADALGAAFVSAAADELVGAEPGDENRVRLRAEVTQDVLKQLGPAPGMSRVGLTWPRFLLRLPYGAASSPTEDIDYEELPAGGGRRDQFLWGNGAWCCATLLGQAFTRSGAGMRPGVPNQLTGLPVYLHESDGETTAKPCGEFLLRDVDVEGLAELGLIPLVSVRGTDAVTMPVMQSLTRTSLLGPWSS